jgi:hypothetical protein
MDMLNNMPAHTLRGFLGGFLLILGIVLVLGGFGIMEAVHFPVKRRILAVVVGLAFIVGGICFAAPELFTAFSTTSEKKPSTTTSSPSRAESETKPSTTTSLPSPEVQETEGFDVELTACRRSMNSVICEFEVKSLGQDRMLSFGGISGSGMFVAGIRMFDEFGNESNAESIQIADKSRTNEVVASLLIAGVRTKVRFTFAKVNSDAKVITLFDVQRTGFVLKYRNIPIGK